MKADLLSPRATVTRAKSEGLPVSETAVRRWLKTGEIRAVHSGNRALIFWPSVYEYVTGRPYNEQAERPAAGLSA